MQVAHLHSVARASPSFNKFLTKISFVIFDIVSPQNFDHCDNAYLFSDESTDHAKLHSIC